MDEKHKKKPADQDLHCFKKKVQNSVKKKFNA